MAQVKIATWNVNSVKARLPQVLAWIAEENRPEVILLQELKCQTEAFPREAFEELGYNLAIFGQKTYNGVAILSKSPIEDVQLGFPGHTHESRYIEAVIALGKNCVLKIASIYVPNGGEVGSDKFAYKLKFLEDLANYAEEELKRGEQILWGGDYNVAPAPLDVYAPDALAGTTCFHPDEQKRYRGLINMGLHDSFRHLHPSTQAFSWWDYRAGSWQRNNGMRIDHLLAATAVLPRIKQVSIAKHVRGQERSSDHVPVMCTLDNEI